MRLVFGLGLGGLLALGCSSAAVETDAREEPVIGGAPESGYPAVGFLRDNGWGEHGEVTCGATLIAPDVALTAAHCVENTSDPEKYLVGFGTIANDPPDPANVRRKVSEAIRHPSYVAVDSEAGSPHDIAILRLAEPVLDREPAKIAEPETTCDYRYVGYGRTNPGGVFSLHWEAGERKSAQTCVRAQRPTEITIRGVDGGNCWGDSGGPLMAEGKNVVVAVMSRFEAVSPMDSYRCEVGNRMVMIKPAGVRDFIEAYAPAALPPG